MQKKWLVFAVLSALVLGTVAAAPQYTRGTIRGYVFRDANGNGVFDADEEGIPGVYVTVSSGEYQHTYYTGAGDSNGDTPGPGSFGPTALQPGWWKVTLNVPDGYRATTRTEYYVDVPDAGAATGVNFGLVGSGPITYQQGTGVGMGGGAGLLPATGGLLGMPVGQMLALLIGLLGLLVLVGTPWCVARTKHVHKRWW